MFGSFATTAAAKLFSADPKLGFLAHARSLGAAVAAGGALPAGVKSAEAARRMIANDYLDAAVAGFFLAAVLVVLAASARAWWAALVGSRTPRRGGVGPTPTPAPVAGD